MSIGYDILVMYHHIDDTAQVGLRIASDADEKVRVFPKRYDAISR